MTNRGVLVFESGGTKLVAGVAGANAHLKETLQCRRHPGHNALITLKRLMEMGESLKRKYELEGCSFGAVGFGFGGLLRRSTQETFLCLHEEGWEHINITEALR